MESGSNRGNQGVGREDSNSPLEFVVGGTADNDGGIADGSGARGSGSGSGGSVRGSGRGSGIRTDRSSGGGKRSTRRRKETASGARTSEITVAQNREKKSLADDALTNVYEIVFHIVAARKGTHWRLNQDEAMALSKSTVGVIRHIPFVPQKELGILADLSAATVAFREVIQRRIELDKRIAEAHARGERVFVGEPGRQPVEVSAPKVPEKGKQPFPRGDRSEPEVINAERLSPEARGEVVLPEGMTDDRALLEKMGISPNLAEALTTEAAGGPPAVTVYNGNGVTVGDTHPTIIADVNEAAQGMTLEEIVAQNGATDERPLLDILAPEPTFEQR